MSAQPCCSALALLINHNDTAGLRNALETGAEWGAPAPVPPALLSQGQPGSCSLARFLHCSQAACLGFCPMVPCFALPMQCIQSKQMQRTKGSCPTPGYSAPSGTCAQPIR